MPSGFVASHVRRTTRNLFLTHAALLGVCAVMLQGAAEPIGALVQGPRRVSALELQRLARRAGAVGDYVTVRAEDVVQVGERWEEPDSGGRRVVAHLLLAKVGDHALLVEAPPGARGLTLTGRLDRMDSEEYAQLSSALRREHPALIGKVLAVRLDSTRDVWSDDGVFVGIVAAAALLALWKLVQALGRFRNPATHPSMRALSVYGGMSANAKLIDAEVAAGTAKVGSTLLTTNWLLHPSTYALRAAPFGEVVWFHKKVTKHYTNFIPTGKTYELIVHTRQAKEPVAVKARQKHVDQLLTELSARAPWAIAGFSKELEAAMAGPQRAQLLNEVHERRQQAKSAA